MKTNSTSSLRIAALVSSIGIAIIATPTRADQSTSASEKQITQPSTENSTSDKYEAICLPKVATKPHEVTPYERRGSDSKIELNYLKLKPGCPWGQATTPASFVAIDQTTAWNFPATGSRWGTGAATGVTFVGIGATGAIRGNTKNMVNWSVQLGPAFQHLYAVPGNDRTALGIGFYASLNPLRFNRNGFNIYTSWSGLLGNDSPGQYRFQNSLQVGMLYTFANVNIIPDPLSRFNVPEKGLYLRVQPTWAFGLDGILGQVQTQAYLGWAENRYPFSFTIEAGPQFVQTVNRELQTNLGTLFDIGYNITPKAKAYLRYRPALSFGGNSQPAALQLLQAGVNYRF